MYEPWKWKRHLVDAKMQWGERQSQSFLVNYLSKQLGKSTREVMMFLSFAESNGMLHRDGYDYIID